MTSNLSIIYVYLGNSGRKVMNFAPVMHQKLARDAPDIST